MKILFVASECFPVIKTGGLADVVGALPLELEKNAADVQVFLPGFPAVLAGLKKVKLLAEIDDVAGQPARLIGGLSANGLHIVCLDAPHLFDLKGNPYVDSAGQDHPDGLLRYSSFSRVAADYAMGRFGEWKPDVVHAHDWQAGLVAAYLDAEEGRPATVFTIHNLVYQGLFPAIDWDILGLPRSYFSSEALEYWGQISLMKAGLVFADKITTVSPTYALEIQSEEGGMGMHGVLNNRAADIVGIVNGIDVDVWNPEDDASLPAVYSAARIGGKAKCKAALQKAFDLPQQKDAPLFVIVSRLTPQKGLDILLDSVDYLVSRGAQLAILGSGDADLETAFLAAADRYPDQVSVKIGYDEPLAHLLQAGGDFMLVPSRFEPCGLTQLCALRYGALPVVGRVGGLNDTVIDASVAALASGVATGVQFYPLNPVMLASAIDRSVALYQDSQLFTKLRKNAMRQSVGWAVSATLYVACYRAAIGEATGSV